MKSAASAIVITTAMSLAVALMLLAALVGLAVASAEPQQQLLLRSPRSTSSAKDQGARARVRPDERTKEESTTSTTSSGSTVLLDVHSYTFDQFLVDYDRTYYNPVEYEARRAIFEENLRTIVRHNQQQQQQQQQNNWSAAATRKMGGGYWMGINPFADHRPDELFTGYDKQHSRLRRQQQQQQQQQMATASRSTTSTTSRRLVGNGVTLDDPVDQLPSTVDWRTQGVTTPVKNQGMCGSCWAFASTAVLESHVALQTGVLYELSPQELVSCAANRQHCGGDGGCAGATAELALELVRDSGAVQEWSFGYQDAHGANVNCTLAEHTMQKEDDPKMYFQGAVASIVDYVVLPSNNYTALMNAVAKLGPVTVSVACSPWHLYQSGVFYAPLSDGGKATDLNHLVVLEGYGTDEETGEDYWIVRNSWGPRWGERGYIRLKRVGESECGVDETPSHGTACTLDPDGHPIEPEPQTICGNSGILFDSAIPLGGYLL